MLENGLRKAAKNRNASDERVAYSPEAVEWTCATAALKTTPLLS
jgi:hypothetical protein